MFVTLADPDSPIGRKLRGMKPEPTNVSRLEAELAKRHIPRYSGTYGDDYIFDPTAADPGHKYYGGYLSVSYDENGDYKRGADFFDRYASKSVQMTASMPVQWLRQLCDTLEKHYKRKEPILVQATMSVSCAVEVADALYQMTPLTNEKDGR